MSRFRVFRCSRGQQAVELALLLPAFLLVISGGVDLGMAYQVILASGMAAEEAARSLQSTLAQSGGLDPDAPLPGWASEAARAVVATRTPVLDMSVTEVEARWLSPASEVVRRYRPYRFRVVVPDAPNEQVDVDLSHDHGFAYWQPFVGTALRTDSYSVWATVTDDFAVFSPQQVGYPHSHLYYDEYNPNVPWQQYPVGWSTGAIISLIGVGAGAGLFAPFVTTAAATPFLSSCGEWYCFRPGMFRRTQVATPYAQVPVVNGIASAQGPVSGQLTVDDVDNVQGSPWQLRGTFDRADGVQTVGPYAVHRGEREFYVETTRGPAESVFSRPLEVRVRTRIRALTPLMSPFVDGRVIERRVVVQVNWERGW